MEKKVYEKNLCLKIKKEVDAIVIGGGCAGISAAVSCAREGMKVLLIEKNAYLGGMATAGLVGPFMTSFAPEGDKQIIKGIFEEFVERMIKKGGAIHPSNVKGGTSYTAYRVYGHEHCGPFDSEAFKLVAEEMCLENGVELLYNAVVADTCLNEYKNQIDGLIVATKSGLLFVKAKQYVDCTGDADIAYQCGSPFFYGDENSNTQPGSLFFVIKGVNKNELEKVKRETNDFKSMFYQELIAKEIKEGRYSIPREKLALFENPDGTYRVNMSRLYLKDGCDAFEVTKATIEGRKQVQEIISLLRRLIPGCENVELVTTASMLGLRETRRIDGLYTLTWEDVENRKKFDDVIFLSGNSVDLHKGTTGNYIPMTGEPYQVPYRILLPKGINNLLVAGRCCSADRTVLAAIRVMPPVFAMGQAAGTAISIAIKDNKEPSQIDVEKLKNILIKNGAVLS